VTTDDEEPSGVPDSPLDDLFVEGAKYREPSAAERAAWAKQQRKELDEAKKRREKEERQAKRARPGPEAGDGDPRTDAAARTRRPLLAIALLVILTLIAWLLFGRSDNNKSSSGLNQHDHVTTYYALPQDVTEDPTMPDAIRHDIGETQAWLASQTDGHDLRVDTNDGDVVVKTKHLDVTSDDLKAGSDPLVTVADEFRSKSGALPDAILLVFVPVDRGVKCGQGSAAGIAIVFVGSCGGLRPESTGSWPTGTTTVIAHELLHALGAVQPCAPHYGGDGHVDNNDDIMYRESASNGTVALDPGHDDYYDANIPGCPGIEDHPAWTTA
jgi:hypothetical protein